jgi:hypothetical protein
MATDLDHKQASRLACVVVDGRVKKCHCLLMMVYDFTSIISIMLTSLLSFPDDGGNFFSLMFLTKLAAEFTSETISLKVREREKQNDEKSSDEFSEMIHRRSSGDATLQRMYIFIDNADKMRSACNECLQLFEGVSAIFRQYIN